MAAQIAARKVIVNGTPLVNIGDGTQDAKGRYTGLMFGERKAQDLIAWLMSHKTIAEAIGSLPALTETPAPAPDPAPVPAPAPLPRNASFAPLVNKDAQIQANKAESRSVTAAPDGKPTYTPESNEPACVHVKGRWHTFFAGQWFSYFEGKVRAAHWRKSTPAMITALLGRKPATPTVKVQVPAPAPVPTPAPARTMVDIAVGMDGQMWVIWSDGTATKDMVPASK